MIFYVSKGNNGVFFSFLAKKMVKFLHMSKKSSTFALAFRKQKVTRWFQLSRQSIGLWFRVSWVRAPYSTHRHPSRMSFFLCLIVDSAKRLALYCRFVFIYLNEFNTYPHLVSLLCSRHYQRTKMVNVRALKPRFLLVSLAAICASRCASPILHPKKTQNGISDNQTVTKKIKKMCAHF